MTPDNTLNPDRLIWLPLLAVMAAALVAGQARANLHTEARAEVAVALDERLSAEAWCRLQLDLLMGDDSIGLDASALQRILPPSPLSPHEADERDSRHVDAPR